MNDATLAAELERAFDCSSAERRVVVRQARDLVDSGRLERDSDRAVTATELVEHLRDAPSECSLPERWNWWIGSLELAYGGYEQFLVRRHRRTGKE